MSSISYSSTVEFKFFASTVHLCLADLIFQIWMKFIRHSVDVYSSEARQLAYHLLEFMARGAGAEPASLRAMFEGQIQSMRVNYYPPCRQQADRVLGLTAHTDACGLTLLLQTNHDVQGLQVKKDGKWFAVKALEGAFIVNVGDVIEVGDAYVDS